MANLLEATENLDRGEKRPLATGERFYLPELDVLRFFAFMMVFLAHTGPRAEALAAGGRFHLVLEVGAIVSTVGNLGVFVFFMLSAYLITALLLKESGRTGTIDMKAFYIRRVLRIWPLYLLFLAASTVVGLLLPYYRVPVGQLLAMLFLAGNWYFGAHGWGTSFSSPLWSISVEEQFYLIWPALLKFGGRTVMRAVCFLTMTVGFLTLGWLGFRGAFAVPSIWTNSLVLFQFFALGGLIAFFIEKRKPAFGRMTRAALFAAGLTLFVLAVTVFDIHANRQAVALLKLLPGYACVDLGCLAVFFSFLGAAIPASLNLVVYLGRISYGLYVFHELCLEFSRWLLTSTIHQPHSPLKLPLGLLLTIAFAALSYRFIETPFLKLKERFALVESRKV